MLVISICKINFPLLVQIIFLIIGNLNFTIPFLEQFGVRGNYSKILEFVILRADFFEISAKVILILNYFSDIKNCSCTVNDKN